MEGSIAPGQDEFCNFLIDRIAGLSSVPKEQSEILQIYIRLAYGAPESTLNIPFPFAKKHDLFALTVLRLDAVYKHEYHKRKEQLKEKVHMDHDKYRKRMMENIEGTGICRH